jgi:hypothetical protein
MNYKSKKYRTYARNYYQTNKEIISLKRKTVRKNGIKNTELKRLFGITFDDYTQMLCNQKQKCAICNKKETSLNNTRTRACTLSVDHNHKTGKVRGLLCKSCNYKLNVIEDTVFLKKAIKYLKRIKI